MKLDNSGQMRIVEAMIACVILVFGIFATSYFSSVFTTEEGGELEEAGQSVIHVLDNTDLIKQIVQNESNWESNLKSLIGTLLPPGTLYNLTLVSVLTNQTFAAVTNMQEQIISPNLDAVSLQQIITISLPLTRIEQKELDIILVIDRSESMSDKEPGDAYNKLYYAKEAAKVFIDQLNASKDRVGLVSFSGDDDQYSEDDATLNSPLTNNFASVKSKIDQLTYYWRTNMGDAFVEANVEFTAHNRTSAICAIIFLSDGVANEPHFDEPYRIYPYTHDGHHGDTPCPVAQEFALNESGKVAEHDVLIYTVGLGANTSRFDEQLLKEMQTNGYYYAPSGEDLEAIYLAIAHDLLFAVKYDIVIMTLTLVKAG